MYEIGDLVRTKNKVTQDLKDLLNFHGIKPGTEGMIVEISLKINFNGQIITIDEKYVDMVKYAGPKTTGIKEDESIEQLMRMFGMK